MEKVKIIGYTKREYPDKKTGEMKQSQDVYYELITDTPDKTLTGNRCDSTYVNPKDFDVDMLTVGEEYEVSYSIFKRRDTDGRTINDARIVGFTEAR